MREDWDDFTDEKDEYSPSGDRQRYYDGLTYLQRAFVDAFTGSPTKTEKVLRKNGIPISKGYGKQLMLLPHVLRAIRERGDYPERDGLIASREERQIFWTQAMFNDNLSMYQRLKASELLGRSHGDFIDKLQLDDKSHDDWVDEMSEEDEQDFGFLK